MAIINKSKKYKWEFANIGGASRVKISTGEDIAHLDELDPKMWTVLSCPVKGLEICEKSLAYMDTDADGKIRVNDVIATSKWLSAVVKDLNVLTAGQDSISLGAIDQENADETISLILDALSRTEKVVFNLMLRGYSYREIAEIMDRSPKSIDNALQRIRKKTSQVRMRQDHDE